MGDRANIAVRDEYSGEVVYLYAHWSGNGLADDLHAALSKRWRWEDGPYLTRIIFEEMICQSRGSETGFGISTRICDNEHPILIVDCKRKVVGVVDKNFGGIADGTYDREMSFEDFIKLDVDSGQARDFMDGRSEEED